MMRVLAIIGSPRKHGNTYEAVQRVESELRALGQVEVEYLCLSDRDLKLCRGCRVCFGRGEDHCPHDDDMLSIRDKMIAADGLILSSPTYTMAVSALFKNLIDRLSFLCHRPGLFRNVLAVATTGVAGEGTVLRYMHHPVTAWGGRVVGELGVNTGKLGRSPRYQRQVEVRARRAARRFYRAMEAGREPAPSLRGLVEFPMRRAYFQGDVEDVYDKQYWQGRGWLDGDVRYYYPVQTGFVKGLAAKVMMVIVKLFVMPFI